MSERKDPIYELTILCADDHKRNVNTVALQSELVVLYPRYAPIIMQEDFYRLDITIDLTQTVIKLVL